jgi:hypothetical protein
MLAKIKEQELVEISAECQKPNGDFQIWWIQKEQLAVLLLGLHCTQKKRSKQSEQMCEHEAMTRWQNE